MFHSSENRRLAVPGKENISVSCQTGTAWAKEDYHYLTALCYTCILLNSMIFLSDDMFVGFSVNTLLILVCLAASTNYTKKDTQ